MQGKLTKTTIKAIICAMLFTSLSFVCTGCEKPSIEKIKNLFSNSDNEENDDSNFDPFALVGFSFEGITPYARAQIKGNPQVFDDLVFNYSLDRDTNLKNGDILIASCSFDEEIAAEKNIKINNKNKQITVTGLTDEYITDFNKIPSGLLNDIEKYAENRIEIAFSTDEYKKLFARLIDRDEDKYLKYSEVKIKDFGCALVNTCLMVKKNVENWNEPDINKLILTYEVNASVKDNAESEPYDIRLYVGYGFTNLYLKNGEYETPDVRLMIDFGENLDYSEYRTMVIDQYGSTYTILDKDDKPVSVESTSDTDEKNYGGGASIEALMNDDDSAPKEKEENTENNDTSDTKKNEENTQEETNPKENTPASPGNIELGENAKRIIISDIYDGTIYCQQSDYITIPAKRYSIDDTVRGSDGITYTIVDMDELAGVEGYYYEDMYDIINTYGSNPELAIKGYDSYTDTFYLYAFSKKVNNEYRLSAIYPEFGPISVNVEKQYEVSNTAGISLLTYSNPEQGVKITKNDLFSIPFGYIEPEYNGEVFIYFEPGMQADIEESNGIITKLKQI